MAKRLINALGKGLGKTVKDKAKGVASRATRDIPDTKSFYNLGMGVGPFIRNTVQSYQKDSSSTSESDAKKINASLGFAKENVVSQKNMASQLSALTNIMSDIRKISLAQLNLTRSSMNKRFGDRGDYLSQEQKLEGGDGGGRASIAGTQTNPEKGGNKLFGGLLSFMGNNPGISAGLLGILALANAKNISEFMRDSGIADALKEGTKAAVSGIASLIGETIKEGILKGLPSLYRQMKNDVQLALKNFQEGNIPEATRHATNAAKPAGALAGIYAGLKYTPGGLFGKVIGGTVGGIAGYYGTELAGEELANLQQAAANGDKEAIATLQKLGVGAGTAASAYGISKVIKNARTPAVTPTAAPGATGTPTSTPSAPKVPEGKPLTQFGSVGENREMMKNRTVLEKSKASFSKTLQLLRKLIAKIGMRRVAAYVAARFAAAAAIGAAGFAAGPVGFITTALTVGLTIYELYSLLSDLDKEVEGNTEAPKNEGTPEESSGYDAMGNATGHLPGATPTQPPAGSSAPANNPQATNGDFANPLPSAIGSKGRFGEERGDHLHSGVDLSAAPGAPILSVAEGEVIATGDQGNGGLGRFVTIRHPNGMTSTYGHMSSVDVKQGDKLKKGQSIGKVGSTGASQGPHLHIEMKNQNGDYVNPRDYIKGLPAYSGTDSGANPEGSLKTIPGKGTKIDSVQNNTAPGASTPGSKFASVFGFDPSRLGVDLSKELSGDELAQLNSIYSQVTGVQNAVGGAVKEMNKTQQTRSPQQHSDPAPVQTASDTQSKEKDHLWMFYNQSSPYYT